MLRLLLCAAAATLSSVPIFAQNKTSRIEIAPIIRTDNYPGFYYGNNPDDYNAVKLRGTSWGINAAYEFPIMKNTWLKAGAGYYKYSFNNIMYATSLIESTARPFDHPDMPGPLYTDKYSYSTFVLEAGAEREFPFSRDMQFTVGVSLDNYFTFSQYYHISGNRVENDYRTSDTRYLGFSASLQTGIQRTFGRFGLNPRLIIPVFDSWKQDARFPGENNSDSRNKWFRGVGASAALSYSL